MCVDNMRHYLFTILLIVLLGGCAVVEKVHVYFNKEPVNLVSAKRAEYFEVVANQGAKLSDITYQLTGTRSTAAVRAANPNMRSDNLVPGMVLKIPTKLLKPGLRSQSKYIQKDPMPEPEPEVKPKDAKDGKKFNKITRPNRRGEQEILPETFEENGQGDDYDSTPFRHQSGDIVPYNPPKPTARPPTEEEILNQKYKDIMNQLEQ
jgi:hypothetical protein